MCEDGEVRLVGGENERTEMEGRVEMCYNGVWGAVCANGWNEIAANITCNQLGFTNSSELKYSNTMDYILYHNFNFCQYYSGSTQDYRFNMWEDSPTVSLFNTTSCNETHSVLLECVNLDKIGVYNCSNNNIARVNCENLSPDVTTTSTQPTKTSVSAFMHYS